MRKKIDSRIRLLIENAVREKHRSFFFIVGDHGRDQVVNLHYMLSKAVVKSRPSVLWCYKKELGFSSHRKKRMRQIKTMIKRGLLDPNNDDPFELFISSTDIRFCYYKETQSILGNTYGMCILQDFEAITPNILARTIETVEGGGIIVILLRTMTSLRQLHDMTMDVHARYRTESHQDVVARFNERFLLSLADCTNCLVVDDELNVLPISIHTRDMQQVIEQRRNEQFEEGLSNVTSGKLSASHSQLSDLVASLKETPIVGPLSALSRTLDQAKALLTFVEAISDSSLRATVALTASRGRGKSAAMGLAMAAAIAYGYANIFVTSPSPENLSTLFDFVFKGFDALGFEEHMDYDIVQSTNPIFNKAVVRVNVHKDHRQTIQYVEPHEAHVLGQAELLVIDEAAAIPLPLVKKLLGPYLVFMSSTINGYEGTGRSLSLKLLSQLRQDRTSVSDPQSGNAISRGLKEIKLEEPIRYASGDPIEKWMYSLLCLDVAIVPRLSSGCPHPDQCSLYYVDRDTLFSYHKASESFLQRMMALYVASHYKNSPNDLQLMSDAPAHHLFVLLPPVDSNTTAIPEVLCVIQLCLEGQISKQSVMNSFARGQRPSGDLIPWTISQQYQDNDFAGLSGGRIVRIATHPDYQHMGYGKRALSLLVKYFEGCDISLDETKDTRVPSSNKSNSVNLSTENSPTSLQNESLRPRTNLPPLLKRLEERPPEYLDYIGVSYGLTKELFRFWKKGQFLPVYLRLTENELTGEHTCIMLKKLNQPYKSSKEPWLSSFYQDFSKRFLHLLGYNFRKLAADLALDILTPMNSDDQKLNHAASSLREKELCQSLSSYDLKRLESYANNLVDYHLVLDLVPILAEHYFTNVLGTPILSPIQSAILLAIGKQYRTVEDLEMEMRLPSNQILALFNKIVRKMASIYKEIQIERVTNDSRDHHVKNNEIDNHSQTLLRTKSNTTESRDLNLAAEWDPLEKSLDDELHESGRHEIKKLAKSWLENENLDKYAVIGNDEAWDIALSKQNGSSSSNVSLKRSSVPKRKVSNNNGKSKKKIRSQRTH